MAEKEEIEGKIEHL